MGRILDSKGNVQYNAKGGAVSAGAKSSGNSNTSQTPYLGTSDDFKDPASAMAFGKKLLGGGGAMGRLFGAGISKGANSSADAKNMAASYPVVGNKMQDHRVRLSLPFKSKILYNSGMPPALIAPLLETNGIIFPYTPNITFQHTVDYSRTSPTHSNYPFNFYNNSAVQDITVFGTFTVESGPDAMYVLGVIQFLRTITKMFGEADGALAGNPPPVMRLSGHGEHMIPSIPCVVNSFTLTLPADIDYFTIPGSSGTTRVPRASEISVGLTPVYSRSELRTFGLDELASGRGSSRGFI